MLKTDKSTLSKQLTSKVDSENPGKVDVEIIDGFYYMYQIGATLPQTFGKLAESILIKLCAKKAQEVHIVFDRYLKPSIKDCERQNREGIDIPYTINGPLQVRPNDFLKSLKNFCFKKALVTFLAQHWDDDSFVPILQDKKVFITVGEECFSYSCDGNKVIKKNEDNLACDHEEADTRIVYHISKVPDHSNILIRASDTDILIIILGNIHQFPTLNIWLANSATKRGNKDEICISCTKLSEKLGPTLCHALPAFHAFTGSDYTAAFFNKGKVRPWKIFMKHEKIQKIFASLIYPYDIDDNDKMKTVQEFTCLMYGISDYKNVNEARLIMFNKMYGSKNKNEKFMKNIKGFDSTHILPCWESLKQKILRTIYVNSMWLNATEPKCIKFTANNNGWLLLDGSLTPTWFLGNATPVEVENVILGNSQDNSAVNDEDSDICSDEIDSSDDSDSSLESDFE